MPSEIINDLTYIKKLSRCNDIYLKFNNPIQKRIQSALKYNCDPYNSSVMEHEYFGVQCEARLTIYKQFGTGILSINKKRYLQNSKVVAFKCFNISSIQRRINIMIIDNYQTLFDKHCKPNSVCLVQGYCRNYNMDNNKSHIPSYLIDIIIRYFNMRCDHFKGLINIF